MSPKKLTFEVAFIKVMATITYTLSAKIDNIFGKSEILVRFFHGRFNQRAKTRLFVHADDWDLASQRCKIPKIRVMSAERLEEVNGMKRINTHLDEISSLIVQSYMEDSAKLADLPSKWVASVIDRHYAGKSDNERKELTDSKNSNRTHFLDVLLSYIETHKMADSQRRQYRVIYRALHRFALYTGTSIEFEDFTEDTLREIEEYLLTEHEFISIDEHGYKYINDHKYKSVYSQIPECRFPAERGKNTIIKMMSRLRAFFNWAIRHKYATYYPFTNYEMGTPIFCTPFYLTKEERDLIYHADFPNRSSLAVQRDIFILQCYIGCRVGDFFKMTKANVINDAIEYIPRKTKEGRPVVVRVPLTPTAKEILSRYPEVIGNRLMPFISEQRYNDAIKDVIRLAGIDRVVTTINQRTREEEKHPIWEVASSHMARRTLVGNLYKKVKDPNLIAKISGHVEGSRAFNRYRDIDEEMVIEVMKELE